MMNQTPISRQRTLEQERAAAAWQCVQSSVVAKKESESKFARGYAQLARGAGSDILSSGLGQTLAFWAAKGRNDPYFNQLLQDLSSWLRGKLGFQQPTLLEWISVDASSIDYRRALKETMAFLAWIKRFAEAEMPEEK